MGTNRPASARTPNAPSEKRRRVAVSPRRSGSREAITSPPTEPRACDARAAQLGRQLARRGRHLELVAALEQQGETARLDQGPGALDDQLQHPIEVGLASDRHSDGRRRLEALYGALELIATLLRVGVEAGVVDGDRRPVGEDGQGLLVVLVEFAALLLGQVEVAVGLAADEHRHAEEATHRRMPRGEAERPWMLAQISEPERARIIDQHAQDAAPPGERSDRPPRLPVDAQGHEALELVAVLVEDPQGGVARAGELPRRLEQPLEQGLDVELGHEPTARVQQATEPAVVS